jgi:branched-chain amino acid transport system substrate-binding protein
MKRTIKPIWALTLALALVLLACGRGGTTNQAGGSQPQAGGAAAEPGITDTEIKIGGSYPYSGQLVAYGSIGKAVQAYFKWQNTEKGGVMFGDGKLRKVTFISYDDMYAPPQGLANAKRLIEQDKVFALFNLLGTPVNLATWDYINAQKVPDLHVATGATNWGADIQKHPWTIGFQPDYQSESKIYAQYLKATKPNAKIAVLYQNDAYGKDYLTGLQDGIKGTNIQIVATEKYESTDATVDSQVTNLANSGADVFFNVATPKFAAQAIKKIGDTSWKPLQILNNVSANVQAVLMPAGLNNSQGIVSTAYFKDPSNPVWDNDPAMMEYKAKVAQYYPEQGVNVKDGNNAYGFVVASELAHEFQTMKSPTRQALMDAARNQSGVTLPLMLPGITVNTTPTQGYPVRAMQIQQFQTDKFQLQGSVIDVSNV